MGGLPTELVPHFFIGRLRLPFVPSWNAAVEALAELAGHNLDIVWPVLHTNLVQSMDDSACAPALRNACRFGSQSSPLRPCAARSCQGA